jgi:hypothetical protein
MTTKISSLPSLATVTDATIIPVVEGGATKRITGAALKTYTGTAAGPQGPSGPSGAAGSNGASGPSGPSGPGTLNSGTAGYVPYYSGTTTLSAPTSGNLFWDNTNARLGVGVSSPSYAVTVYGTAVTNGDMQRNLQLMDTTSAAAGVGGGISFGGYITGTSGTGEFAGIKGIKENSTAGEYGGHLVFATRVHGGTPTERVRVSNSGTFMVGRTTAVNSEEKFLVYGSTQGIPTAQMYAGWASQPVAAGSTVLRISANMNSGNDAQLLWLEHANPFGSTSYAFGAIKVTGNTYAAAQNVFGVDPGTGMTTINRPRSDGTLMDFLRNGSSQGSITVSGSTVSYNAFAGSHWSQWTEGRGHTPEILRGTVLSTIDEMCVWKSLQWMEEYESHTPDDQNSQIIDATTIGQEGNTQLSNKKPIQHTKPYKGTEPVGAIVIEDGIEKVVVDDGNERLPKVKVSDVAGDRRVYGVFMDYDTVQDIHVTAVGAFVVRIAAGITVNAGDLLESNGDGCARVQSDDLIRSSTIGKVTTNIQIAEYADGSYTVPCVLFCG